MRKVISEMVWMVLPRPYRFISWEEWREKTRTYHLVGEDTVDTLLIQCSKPVQSLQLILFQRSHKHSRLADGELAIERCWVLEVQLVRIN